MDAWSPLRHRVFRTLWLGGLLSNIGTFMQVAAAAWVMTSLTGEPSMVALLQTAVALPTFALALFAGALADVLDRRRLLMTTQALGALVAAGLGVATLTGMVTPTRLLAFTAAIGVVAALSQPAWISITPEVVPRPELAPASALGSLSINLSQAIGPALGGLIIAAADPGWVFVLNAASFVAVIVAVRSWRPAERGGGLPPEHLMGAMRTGLRYVRNSPSLLVLYARLALFAFCSSCLPALLPLVARGRLGLGAAAFGLLFGALGLGAVLMAAALPKLRARVGPDVVAAVGAMGYVVAFVAIALATHPAVVLLALVVAGAGLISVLTTITATVQAVLPNWVRGRGLSVFWLVMQGSMAGGALSWGAVAGAWSVQTALLAAAGVTLLVALAAAPMRLAGRAEVDIRPDTYPMQLEPMLTFDRTSGPVLITVEWRVKPEDVPRLATVMRDIERERRRNGAMTWRLYEDVDDPGRVVEAYTCATWAEHEHQHQRVTADDRKAEGQAVALLIEPRPVVTHLMAVRNLRESEQS